MCTDPERLVIAARLYYQEDLTQEQIAAALGVSRPQVSRILKQARELGLVEVTVHDSNASFARLGEDLRQAFGLQYAVVVPRLTHVDVKAQVGRAAAQLLGASLRPSDILGVSGGTTIYEMTKQLQHAHVPDLTVVQLMGGLAAVEDVIHSGEIARRFKDTYAGRIVILSSPAKLGDASMVEQLSANASVAEGLRVARACTIAVVGIGTIKLNATLVARGYLDPKEREELEAEGAVGDICLRFFDSQGRPCARFNSRVLGISLEEIACIPLVIGVAGGAEGKSAAILAALRGKYVKALVTDSDTARDILAQR